MAAGSAGSAEAGSEAADAAAPAVEAGSAAVGAAAGAAGAVGADYSPAMLAMKAKAEHFRAAVGELLEKGEHKRFVRVLKELIHLPEDRDATRAQMIEELYDFLLPGADLCQELEALLPSRLRKEYAATGERLVLIDQAMVEELFFPSSPAADSDAPAADGDAPAADGFDGASAAAAAAAAQGFTLRSPQQIAAAKKRGKSVETERGTDAFNDLPQGPFSSKDAIAHAYERSAKENGQLMPFFTAHRAASKSRGEQRTLCCPFGAKERTGKGTGARKSAPKFELDNSNICMWSVTFEWSTVGWVILRARLVHSNHTCDAPKVLSEAESSLTFTEHDSKIPDQLVNLVTDDIKLLNLSIEMIKRFLDAKAQALKIEITWLYNDVYNLFSTSFAEKEYDATGLVELLIERRDKLGLAYKIRHGKDGRLAQVFFEMEGAAGEWALRGEDNIVLFDTTWGTNIYGMKLGCFTTIGSDGQTIILGATILINEDEPSFEWAFRHFSRLSKSRRA